MVSAKKRADDTFAAGSESMVAFFHLSLAGLDRLLTPKVVSREQWLNGRDNPAETGRRRQ
jgi:hypothetical protein